MRNMYDTKPIRYFLAFYRKSIGLMMNGSM